MRGERAICGVSLATLFAQAKKLPAPPQEERKLCSVLKDNESRARSKWIPAFAGMTSLEGQKLDPSFRWDDEPRGRARANGEGAGFRLSPE